MVNETFISFAGTIASRAKEFIAATTYFIAVFLVATVATGAVGFVAAPLAGDPPLTAVQTDSADDFATP